MTANGIVARGARTALARAGLVMTCGVILSAGARGQDGSDEIELANMRPVSNVTIVEDSWKQVCAKKGEGQVKFDACEVARVYYDNMPAGFNEGVRRVAGGYYSKAIEMSFLPLVEKLDGFAKVGGQPFPKQYVLYYLGLAHLRRAAAEDPKRAREYFKQLLSSVPDTRFIFDAMIGIAESWRIEGRADQAATEYASAMEKFEKMAGEVSHKHKMYILRLARLAELKGIEMLVLQGRHDDAAGKYAQLETKTQRYNEMTDITWMARVGSAQALVAAGSYRVAIGKCQQMIDKGVDSGHTEYLGGAYMALADSYFERGKESNDPEDYVFARWNYLRVATLYFEDKTLLLSKARYRAGMCYLLLQDNPHEGKNDKVRVATARKRARRQFQQVVRDFPDNEWADQAKRELEKLGEG